MVVVIVGVAVYISVPVALAVIYVSRARATLRHGIPRTSGSSWVGFASVGMAPSSGRKPSEDDNALG
ncbi:MAG: hypothetical protein A3H29_14835 [Acidobacteria bacterium RIFCSPLOWO2_02_FULL_67_21]|nr:MAG: hypothetical protein A3H29_14835 [Acidobacteria bacterium RIFCSPLOWO2_02_FULL_67_21]